MCKNEADQKNVFSENTSIFVFRKTYFLLAVSTRDNQCLTAMTSQSMSLHTVGAQQMFRVNGTKDPSEALPLFSLGCQWKQQDHRLVPSASFDDLPSVNDKAWGGGSTSWLNPRREVRRCPLTAPHPNEPVCPFRLLEGKWLVSLSTRSPWFTRPLPCVLQVGGIIPAFAKGEFCPLSGKCRAGARSGLPVPAIQARAAAAVLHAPVLSLDPSVPSARHAQARVSRAAGLMLTSQSSAVSNLTNSALHGAMSAVFYAEANRRDCRQQLHITTLSLTS